jgi:hypothetical protein
MASRSDASDCQPSRSTVDPVDEATVEIGHYRGGLDALLAGIENAGLEGASIELDGGDAELWALIDECTAPYPNLVAENKRARYGVWRFGPFMFGRGTPVMPIEGDNLARVRALLERKADPDVAFHVNVHDHEGYLIEAPDVGDNVIFVSPRLPQRAVDAIRAALREDLRPPRDS